MLFTCELVQMGALGLLFVLLASCAAARAAREGEARIAYFVQVSETTLPLLPRLLRVIWHEDNHYVVHFDAKIPAWQRDYTLPAILRRLPHHRNVRVMASEVITYRGISMAINTMNAMQVALDAGDWDYFINISGADYPLVAPAQQRALLAPFARRNATFLAIAPQTWARKALEYRASRLYTDTSLAMSPRNSKLVDSGVAHPLHTIFGFRFAAAEAWMMCHRTFVDYMLRAPKARRFFAAFAYIAEPEEHLFPTVAINTPRFNATLVHDAMRGVFWRNPSGKTAGQHPFHIDERDANGNWIFLNGLRRSGVFFARKISKQNSKLLDIIDTEMSGVAPTGVQKTKVDAFLGVVRTRLRQRGRHVLTTAP